MIIINRNSATTQHNLNPNFKIQKQNRQKEKYEKRNPK